jgi:D-alanyl-lipoteichoic acid acyltransferase DltB (MBOAT superfamily)
MDYQVMFSSFRSRLLFIVICRYIYIPLGGKHNALLNIVLIFSFVALWHDLNFRLLAWGWLVALFIVPEVLAQIILPANKVN